MRSTPSGRAMARHASSPISAELAHGMDLTLESTGREIGQVRSILREAIERLLVEFGARALGPGVVALQFQDLSDQLLASAERRIELVRIALGRAEPASAISRTNATAAAGGTAEYF